LKGCDDSPSVALFRDLLTDSSFHEWMTGVTGVEGILPVVDMFGAIYQDGSYLQCHDDKLEGRRIAYIYYLVPEDWSAEDGGKERDYWDDQRLTGRR
jgi:prolyl 3-hydroxylase /prolyl 3,4-dihydroxylase